MCRIIANIEMDFPTAQKANGISNGIASLLPLLVTLKSPLNNANGLDQVEELAPVGKQTTGREARHNMPKRDYRRRVEGGTICDKGHDIWSEQRDCRYASRDSLMQAQCDHCVDGFCEYEPEGK